MIEQLKRNRRLLAGSVAAVVLFAILLALFTDLPSRDFWLAVLAAAIPALLLTLLSAWPTASAVVGADTASAPGLLNQITSGDLTANRELIEEAAGDRQMASAIRGLVLNLERTISRFGQLVQDVLKVSQEIGLRSRSLSQSATRQVSSAASTTGAITEIDDSLGSVQKSMENLSLNAEETSTSVLQMTASIEEVGRISDTLQEFVEQTASAIEEMIASINEVAGNTESFSSFTVETASAIIEMNATSVEIGKSARQSSDFARYVTESANEGREAARVSAEGMRKIQVAVEEAKSALNMLGERSQEIGEIVRVIDEIAGQTNLLALNAAIIAAQAGDRGKGFAVVADEIRDLSERTSVSTEEIRTLISNVQKGVDRAVEQMNISSDRVGEGVSLAARAENVLDKILDLTARSNQSILEIAKATEEQTRGSQQATSAIEEVTKMVQTTATAVQQQSVTSRKIGEQAATVRDYTKHLRRALEEQKSGSRSISQAMDNIMTAVATVFDSTSVLTTKSSSIVDEMRTIEQASRDSSFTVADLSHMSNTLRHEASLLQQELRRFKVPEPVGGGKITTATVLPHKLSLDPIDCQFLALNYPQRAIHETLIQFGEGAEIVAGIAERWEVLEHGSVYRFHLRAGAKFHNGRNITATDVEGSFLRLMSPRMNSAGKWIMRDVVGADDVIEGRAQTAAGIRIVNDRTVDIVLEKPLAFFLHLLSMPEAAIIPADEMRDRERARLKPIGAGPFEVVEAEEGRRVQLRRTRNYYDPVRPHVDEVEFRLDLKSSREVVDAFMRGELNIAHGIPPRVADEFRRNPQYAPFLLDTIQLHTSYLAFDCSHPPFDRREVRQAMNHAINRSRINESIFSGQAACASSILPPGLLGYDPNMKPYVYDPGRAKELLRAGGYPNGFEVEYWAWDTDEFFNSKQVPMIIEDLAAVGVRVKVIDSTNVDARRAREKVGHNVVFAGNWFADFPDSDNFFFSFFHKESEAIPGINYKSEDMDARIEEARRSSDSERRTAIYRELNQLILDEAPMVFLFHERLFVLHDPGVRAVRTYLVPPPVRYSDVWIER